MKFKLIHTLTAASIMLLSAGTAGAQSYINATVGGTLAPGIFGQITIGSQPPPPVINAQPVIVGQPVVGAAPMYLYVPTEHSRDWARYCAMYKACGHPVHFVQLDERNRWWEHRDDRRHEKEPVRRADERRDERRDERENEDRRERR